MLQHCSQIYNLHAIASIASGIYPTANNNLCLSGNKSFLQKTYKMHSLLILMCCEIKLNQQQQEGSERKGITSSTKNCSPTSILFNLQTTISNRIDYIIAISTETQSLWARVSSLEQNITNKALF